MKLKLLGKIATITALSFASITPHLPSNASTFGQQEVNQEEFIAIARPYGDNKYDLLIIRQIPGQQKCWSEYGSNPVLVNPLLRNFNFTGSCERSTDSNGYSIRVDGQDYGLDYLLRIVERNGELILVGTHRSDPSQSEIVVGRSDGIASGFIRLHLNPGWRFTKRAYHGKVLSHVYLTGDSSNIPKKSPSVATTFLKSRQDTQPMREMTFTADSQSAIANSRSASGKSLSSPTTTTTPPSSRTLPPPPQPRLVSTTPEPLPEFSDLPPLSPPNQGSSNKVVPPPRPSTNSGGKGFSDLGSQTNSRGYRVIVAANNSSQQVRVRSLYPEAFPTSHNGRSMWQVGLFSSRNNAEKAHRTLENAGLRAIIIP